MSLIEISVVVPVYGCTAALRPLHAGIREVLNEAGLSFELILVDDRGPDDPWPVIRSLVAEDSRVRGVRLSRRFGQHPAIMAGLRHARGNWVVVMDCDLQDDPREIPVLYRDAVDKGVDISRARRMDRTEGWFRRYASRGFFGLLGFLIGVPMSSEIGNFGIYSHRVIDAVLSCPEQNKFLPAIVQWVGYSQSTITVQHQPRFSGKSGYSLRRLLRLAWTTIINFSEKPLHLMLQFGALVVLIAVLYSLSALVRWLFWGVSVSGWTSIILSIWFFGGLNIMFLGLLGAYMARLLEVTKGRPDTIVAETANIEGPGHADA